MGLLVAVERDAAGEKIVGLTMEYQRRQAHRLTLGPKLYNDLTPEEIEKAGGLLSEGRRVKLSLRDCRESGRRASSKTSTRRKRRTPSGRL